MCPLLAVIAPDGSLACSRSSKVDAGVAGRPLRHNQAHLKSSSQQPQPASRRKTEQRVVLAMRLDPLQAQRLGTGLPLTDYSHSSFLSPQSSVASEDPHPYPSPRSNTCTHTMSHTHTHNIAATSAPTPDIRSPPALATACAHITHHTSHPQLHSAQSPWDPSLPQVLDTQPTPSRQMFGVPTPPSLQTLPSTASAPQLHPPSP